MLFLCNIFFVIIKVSEQCSFYFAYDSLFNAKYNGLLDIVKAPGSVLAGVLVPIIVERLGAKSDSKKFYQVCCVLGIVLNGLFALLTYNGIMNKPADKPVSTLTGVIVLAFSMLVTFPLEFKNLMQKERLTTLNGNQADVLRVQCFRLCHLQVNLKVHFHRLFVFRCLQEQDMLSIQATFRPFKIIQLF